MKTVKQMVDEAANAHGHAAIISDIAARIAWNAKWLPQDEQCVAAQAVRLLHEAAALVEKLEISEDRDRIAQEMQSAESSGRLIRTNRPL